MKLAGDYSETTLRQIDNLGAISCDNCIINCDKVNNSKRSIMRFIKGRHSLQLSLSNIFEVISVFNNNCRDMNAAI